MTNKDVSPASQIAAIFHHALQKTHIEHIMKKNVSLSENILRISDDDYDLSGFNKIFIGGIGTAALQMGRYMENLLGDKISQGMLLVPPGFSGKKEKLIVKEVISPLFDSASSKALNDLFYILSKAKENDLIILLLSKGTSEMLEALPQKISFSDYNSLIKKLVQAGAQKKEINAIKTHLSLVKGGQFLDITHPSTLITLIVSDEPGGDLQRTYLSPTAPDPATFDYCRRILLRYKLPLTLPPPILNHFNSGMRKLIPETVKHGDEKLSKVHNYIISASFTLAADAFEAAGGFNLTASILSTRLEGEAESLGRFFGQIITDMAEYGIPMEPPCAFIAAGRLENSDDRRLEELCVLALSTALAIDGIEGAQFLAGTSFLFEKQGYWGCIVNHETAGHIYGLNCDPINLIKERKAHKVMEELKLLLPGSFNPVDCGDIFILMMT